MTSLLLTIEFKYLLLSVNLYSFCHPGTLDYMRNPNNLSPQFHLVVKFRKKGEYVRNEY